MLLFWAEMSRLLSSLSLVIFCLISGAFRDKFELSVFEISLLEIKLGVEYVELNE